MVRTQVYWVDQKTASCFHTSMACAPGYRALKTTTIEGAIDEGKVPCRNCCSSVVIDAAERIAEEKRAGV